MAGMEPYLANGISCTFLNSSGDIEIPGNAYDQDIHIHRDPVVQENGVVAFALLVPRNQWGKILVTNCGPVKESVRLKVGDNWGCVLKEGDREFAFDLALEVIRPDLELELQKPGFFGSWGMMGRFQLTLQDYNRKTLIYCYEEEGSSWLKDKVVPNFSWDTLVRELHKSNRHVANGYMGRPGSAEEVYYNEHVTYDSERGHDPFWESQHPEAASRARRSATPAAKPAAKPVPKPDPKQTPAKPAPKPDAKQSPAPAKPAPKPDAKQSPAPAKPAPKPAAKQTPAPAKPAPKPAPAKK
eukprot:gene2513-2872_t